MAPDRVATRNLGIVSAPSDVFRTRDGWVMVSSVGTPMFRRWAKLVGATDWLDDPRFVDDASRAQHGEEVSARMAEWMAARETEEALEALERAMIPAAPILSPQQALEHPHIRAAGLLEQRPYPGMAATAPLAPTPVQFSALETGFRLPPPRLGQHTEEILGELGYDSAQIAALRTANAI